MTRNRLLLACLPFGLAAALTACRTNHLGNDTAGHAYRAALDAQRRGDETVTPPALSAQDAKRVISVHETGDTKAAGSSSGGLATTALPSAPLSTGGGSWPGASGNITLEAK
jgi:hypothetical protein